MDNNFYPISDLNQHSSRYVGRVPYDTIGIDDINLMSPDSSHGNMNFNPSLNNNFKRRMMNKPLQLDQRRLSKLHQATLSSTRNDSSDGNYKIPSIHKHKNSNVIRNAKLAQKLNKNGSGKALSTSRNRNLHINQSFNGKIPKLKYMPNGNNHNFMSPSNGQDMVGINNTIDIRGSQTNRNLFFSPQKDGDGSSISMQMKINELKDIIAEKDVQIDHLKKSIKYTQINELKQENEVLYEE